MKLSLLDHSLLIGGIVTIIGIIGAYVLYRFYKRVGRRCRKGTCGSVWGPRRFNKIYLAEDEVISLWNKDGKWRWWIRRVSTETFVRCKKCGHIESVKYTEGPISVWHAWWVRAFDPGQYEMEPALSTVSYLAGKDRLTGKHREPSEASGRADVPPFDPTH